LPFDDGIIDIICKKIFYNKEIIQVADLEFAKQYLYKNKYDYIMKYINTIL
jgi:hypothetical protein